MDEQIVLHFEKTGLLSLIVDGGRPGFQAFGIPPGGAMDTKAAHSANWLVGNKKNSAVIEITIKGPSIRIEGHGQIAITGADISAKINGYLINRYETISINDGDKITFGKLNSGCRSYLAISGIIDTPEWMESKCTIVPNAEVLIPGSIIKKGRQLLIHKGEEIKPRQIPQGLKDNYQRTIKVHVIKGPEYEDFTKKETGLFWNTRHTISSESNRMGYRLEGSIGSDLRNKSEIISSGIVPGTIQITNAGQAIILLVDAQTSGGYRRIGNVISVDLDLLAQLKPGDDVMFSPIRLEEVHKEKVKN